MTFTKGHTLWNHPIALLFVIFLIPAFSQAATFGYTTIGASSQTCFFDLGANELSSRYGGIASTTEIGSNLVSISGYYTSSIVGDTMDVFLAFNERDGAGSNSHSQIGSGESSNIDDASFPRWVTVSATGTITTGVDYVISGTCTAPDGSASASSVFDSVAGAPSYREDFNQATEALAYTAAQENPWTDTVSTGNLYSFYVTYDSTPQTILRINNGTIRINNGTLDL